MISILSEKTIAIPELGQDLAVRARPGFNVIATSNLRDRGVHEMSSALKRRFNLRQCILSTTLCLNARSSFRSSTSVGKAWISISRSPPTSSTCSSPPFRISLRPHQRWCRNRQAERCHVDGEAVNVAHAASLEAGYLDTGRTTPAHIARQMQGIVLKDDPEDGRKFRAYIDHVAKERARSSPAWKAFYAAASELKLDVKPKPGQ